MLPALPLSEVLDMDPKRYFNDYARYMGDAPRKYCLRVGSRTLRSNDTMDLKEKFLKYVAVERRKRTLAEKMENTKTCHNLKRKSQQTSAGQGTTKQPRRLK